MKRVKGGGCEQYNYNGFQVAFEPLGDMMPPMEGRGRAVNVRFYSI